MLRKDLLPVLARSLVKVGLSSEEFKKEVSRYNRNRDLFSCFYKLIEFNFSNFAVKLLIQAPEPAKIRIENIKYEVSDRDTDEILISNI